MTLFYGLPHSLLVFLLALPLLSSSITRGTVNTTSPLDPFRQLRLRASHKPSEPICCLIPLSTEPLPTTAEFLSFEEWKSKQREIQAQAQVSNQTPSPEASAPEALPGSTVPTSTTLGETEPPPVPLAEPPPALSPHFRVPLTDRFNYASLDCSARVHTSHHSARSPAAILSSKKDRYMLSPCSTDPNFVVVELCDDIRIDTVQLANFEFFSGVFRDFKVSVAQTYTSDGQGWIEAGTYRAKNIRGVQSFHPLVELRPFYRYIRIDFLTHYGSEFYCPISLLRVYGLTQMEEWKWEVWQSGSENKGAQILPELEDVAQDSGTVDSPAPIIDTTIVDGEATATDGPSRGIDSSQSTNATSPTAEKRESQSSTFETVTTPTSSSQGAISLEISPSSKAEAHTPLQSAVPPATEFSEPSTATPTGSNANPNNDSTLLANYPSPADTTGVSPSNNASVSTSHTSSIQIIVPIPSPSVPSGESIYRTIMNRLAMLETNTTLYQRYVEEQTLQVREALRRLEEDVGRLEGISKSQQHMFSKTMNELELRRRQMEEERWELLTKVNSLADEVTLEKRLGIAQLCLLLTVLVFMALTRGSRADAASLLDGTMHRLNSFSRRQHWSSAEWRRKSWTSRSPTPTPMNLSTVEIGHKEESRPVPISSLTGKEKELSYVPFPSTPLARSRSPRSHARQPTTPRHQDVLRLANTTRPVGRLRRSNSHTTPAHGLLSAKRFARTAHLHEVQFSIHDSPKAGGAEAEDVLAIGDGSPKPHQGGQERSSSVRTLPDTGILARAVGGEESETGSWTDTEAGSDGEVDLDEVMDPGGQDIELESESPFEEGVPIMSAPPFGRTYVPVSRVNYGVVDEPK